MLLLSECLLMTNGEHYKKKSVNRGLLLLFNLINLDQTIWREKKCQKNVLSPSKIVLKWERSGLV